MCRQEIEVEATTIRNSTPASMEAGERGKYFLLTSVSSTINTQAVKLEEQLSVVEFVKCFKQLCLCRQRGPIYHHSRQNSNHKRHQKGELR